MRTIVIGAGLSGLAAAAHLRGSGHDVSILEASDDVGGRAGRASIDGFTFDTGPVVMTMPELLAEPLSALGADLDTLVPMRRLDPSYRAVFADGSQLPVAADMATLRATIEAQFGGEEADGFDRFLTWLTDLYDLEFSAFIDTNYDGPFSLARDPIRMSRLARMGALRSLADVVGSFFRDDRLRKVFSFQALYAGVSPKQARAVLAVIAYMDIVRGVYYPEGGMHAIARGLARALEDSGAELHRGVRVARILRRDDGRVAGVETESGDRVFADAVVCTVDLPVAYERLLPDLRAPRAARVGTYSPSAVVWHVGAGGQPAAGTAHHNIHFGEQWESAFTSLLADKTFMPDPSRLVTVPSLTDPTVAPAGASALYVLEPVPHLGSSLDWAREAGPLRERLGGFLEANGYPTDIRAELFVDPRDWQAQGMHLGTPFALAHTFTQSGPFRPPNTDARVPGLVFAGSGTTPGVGVPMVLLSGKHAAERVNEYAGAMGSVATR